MLFFSLLFFCFLLFCELFLRHTRLVGQLWAALGQPSCLRSRHLYGMLHVTEITESAA